MTTSVFVAFALILATAVLLKNGVTGTSIGIVVAFLALAAIPWYFGTRNRSADPSRTERVLATVWVWFRRIAGFTVGGLMILGAAFMAFSEAGVKEGPSRWSVAGGLFLFGLFLIYFGIIGQGTRRYDWRDDVELHKANKRRYRWWF